MWAFLAARVYARDPFLSNNRFLSVRFATQRLRHENDGFPRKQRLAIGSPNAGTTHNTHTAITQFLGDLVVANRLTDHDSSILLRRWTLCTRPVNVQQEIQETNDGRPHN